MLIKSRCDTFSIADFLSTPVSFLVPTMAPSRECIGFFMLIMLLDLPLFTSSDFVGMVVVGSSSV